MKVSDACLSEWLKTSWFQYGYYLPVTTLNLLINNYERFSVRLVGI